VKGDGPVAEKLAAEFLQRNGLRLVESNFRCRFGEVDLILHDGDTIVFVEVRLRSNPGFGGAAASITPSKQEKIVRAAQWYLQQGRSQAACRFDAVLLESLDAGRVEWIKNAFEGA
jgi:putative endonuclease